MNLKNSLGLIFVFVVISMVGCTRYYDKHCNLFTTDEGILCTTALLGALSVGVVTYQVENKKEKYNKQEFLIHREVGVMKGVRSDLESCVLECHLSSQDSAEQIALSKLASEKLIQLDDPDVEMTTKQIKAMIRAYLNLQYELSFSNTIKKYYIERSWNLVKQVKEKDRYYEINQSDASTVGGLAYLFNKRLIDTSIEDAIPIFDQCMLDRFWLNSHFEPSSLNTLQFCKISLNWYLSSLKKSELSLLNFKEAINNKWYQEWDTELKRKSSDKTK
jgi:hypothetical protein